MQVIYCARLLSSRFSGFFRVYLKAATGPEFAAAQAAKIPAGVA